MMKFVAYKHTSGSNSFAQHIHIGDEIVYHFERVLSLSFVFRSHSHTVTHIVCTIDVRSGYGDLTSQPKPCQVNTRHPLSLILEYLWKINNKKKKYLIINITCHYHIDSCVRARQKERDQESERSIE